MLRIPFAACAASARFRVAYHVTRRFVSMRTTPHLAMTRTTIPTTTATTTASPFFSAHRVSTSSYFCPSSSFSSSANNNNDNNNPEKQAVDSSSKQEDEPGPLKPDAAAADGKSFMSWRMALIGVFGVFLASKLVEWRQEQLRAASAAKFVQKEGGIQLGGPYELIDTSGKLVSNKDLNDKYTLLYFGFSACPDICPVELMKMSKALESIPKKVSDQIQPVFISLDPKRDTPERLAEYSKKYDPRLIWLTGTAEQIAPVAKAFRVYFSIPEVDSGDDDDYLVDHSIFFYLMDHNNQLVQFYGKNATPEEIAASLKQHVRV